MIFTVTVQSVADGSPAQAAGILPGDIIIEINGCEIADVLDYRFYLTERRVTLKLHRAQQLFDVTIEKDEYDDIGVEFSTFLMDEKQSCKNKCIFCFIDQMPKGCRDSLYFKDDDSRMSFLRGNYITGTNLSERDIERIIKMKLSPVNISVHTTNPELRVFMMKNKRSGEVMSVMRRFARGNVSMNAQIVLCRGINDGDELDRTMRDLFTLWPQLQNVSVVPCGLTDHRQGLFPLEVYDAPGAREVVRQVESFARECRKRVGQSIFFCGDELYITAGLKLPDGEYYEGYAQLENGVGMTALLCEEFEQELSHLDEYNTKEQIHVSIATAQAPYPFIKALCEKLCARCPGLKIDVFEVKNRFFGKNITVAGLLTGGDLIKGLEGCALGDELLIPSVMLRHEGDLFLDGTSPADVAAALGVAVRAVPTGGDELIKSILHKKQKKEMI